MPTNRRKRKPPSRTKKPLDPRVEYYVDSPFIENRLRRGQRLLTAISGQYGVYSTVVDLSRPANDSCSCPSDSFPCKHVQAVRETWRRYPESFFDLGAFLIGLNRRTKLELVAAIGLMAEHSPAALSAVGVEELADEADDEDGW